MTMRLDRTSLRDIEYKKIEARGSDDLGRIVMRLYDETFAYRNLYRKQHEEILKYALDGEPDTSKNDRLLEIGCGFGYFLNKAKERIKLVYGIDIGPENVRMAKGIVGLSIDVMEADGENMPFKNAYFDYVVMKGAVHHLGHPEAAFKEAHRVLKKRGKLVIFEGNPDSIYRKIALAVAALMRIKHESSLFRHLTAQELQRMLVDNNFEVEIKNMCGLFAPLGLLGFGTRKLWKVLDSIENFIKTRFNLFKYYNILIARPIK